MRNLVDEKRLEELINREDWGRGDKDAVCETLSLALKVVPAAYALCKAVEERNAGVVTDGADILMALRKLEPLLVPFAPFYQDNLLKEK